ncbi:MAG: dihydroorotate dehydrogenase electron transfer subunit [Candidatus Sumerlaeia bacterium]|nr:dihydroorotate dehydrogenase electron transfer subunit [Candidatus Sumerlaeia bacterium]
MTASKFNLLATLIDVRQISADIFLHRYACPPIASASKPGQFVMLRVQESLEPFLPRPFSIADVDESKETISILFNIRGIGTRLLAQKHKGETVRMFGPLGSGFTINPHSPEHLLVAGGIGMAPLFFLLQELRRRSLNAQLIFGACTSAELCLRKEILELTERVVFITEDGSLGRKGLITDFINQYLSPNSAVYVCGPSGLINKMVQITRKCGVLEAQFSMEAQMACGVGACLGCVIKTAHGYKRVCTEGPVFSLTIL